MARDIESHCGMKATLGVRRPNKFKLADDLTLGAKSRCEIVIMMESLTEELVRVALHSNASNKRNCQPKLSLLGTCHCETKQNQQSVSGAWARIFHQLVAAALRPSDQFWLHSVPLTHTKSFAGWMCCRENETVRSRLVTC